MVVEVARRLSFWEDLLQNVDRAGACHSTSLTQGTQSCFTATIMGMDGSVVRSPRSKLTPLPGLLTIIRKNRIKEKEMRVLFLCVLP